MHFHTRLLKWFDTHGRKNLPWQKKITLYRVWVSEIMLQQTQVTTVIPYFNRFIKQFPTVEHLAKASEDEVMHLWSGLGYYSRARNLHAAAKMIKNEHKGQFPKTLEDCLRLPGIGRSTAGAILSIGTQQPFAILDGNVKRVLSRHFAIAGWPNDPKTTQVLWELSERLLPKKRGHHYTQAIMDLGATVCTRAKPRCHRCPFEKSCQAKADNTIEHYPGKRPKVVKPTRSTQALIVTTPTHVLLEKRPRHGIWGGLWSLPEAPVRKAIKHYRSIPVTTKHYAPFRHTFSHFFLDIHPVLCQTTQSISLPNHQWYSWQKLDTVGLPSPIRRLLNQIKEES